MFDPRATAFVSTSSALRIVPDWPRLPSGLQLDRVSGVAADSHGFIYVAHRGEHPLLRLRPDGTLDREIGADLMRKSIGYDLRGDAPVPMERRHWLHGLHVDPWDNIWVTDVGRHLIWRFNPAGQLTLTLGGDGETGCDGLRFYQPTHVCVVPSGEFFVTDGYGNSRVAKFSAKGEFLFAWGRRGTADGEFHTPHVITVDAAGRLYVGDRENDRVQLFTPDGRWLATWPGLHSVDGLHAAADGLVYGAAGLDNAVIRLDRAGRLLDVWAAPGAFCYPHGIWVTPDGAIYTAEIAGSRVLKLAFEPHA